MSKYKPNIDLKNQNNTTTAIFNHVKKSSEVLDVGCASGYLAELLTKKKGAKVVGIEVNREDAKKAGEFCEFVISENLEGLTWEKKLKGRKFDHIIFADVLEHLKDPETVLKTMKSYLKDDGSILVSIPNIGHVSVRLELLEGNFIPERIGILDNTHLKYFTRSTFSDLVQKAGYKIKTTSASSFDFPEEWTKNRLIKLGLKPTAKFMKLLASPDSVAYQYFFELVKGNGKLSNLEVKKPIYIVRKFLRSIELDHAKFKKENLTVIKSLEQQTQDLTVENEQLRKQLGIKPRQAVAHKTSLAAKVSRKFGKLIGRG